MSATLRRWLGARFGRGVGPRGALPSTEEYCREHGLSCRRLRQGEVSHRRPPETAMPAIHWKFLQDKERAHRHPPVFLASLPHGIVVGERGAVLTAQRHLLLDVSPEIGPVGATRHSLVADERRLPRPRRHRGRVAVVSAGTGDNYFHWLTDALPRLAILRMAGQGWDGIDGFIVPPAARSPIIARTLDLLRIPPEKRIVLARGRAVQADELLLPSLPGSTGNPPPWVADFLCDSFREAGLAAPETGLPRRFYVSRRDSRRVTNEAALLPLFQAHGIAPIHPEALSFERQIALFARAELIVAPHGAALTSLVFCAPRTRVLELFSPAYVNVCYWAIANLRSLDYAYLEGEGPPGPGASDPLAVRQDLTVSPARLAQWLADWGGLP